ncbi:hypothetical protein Pta02_05940 [Planobispora takensis]|uniref:Uncharacterized protein n=1 Tax=Planobispora takensis TaxID=1367882 RepID=A0A8J3WQY7_9ACTN|nr:hypothetical protein Pta02_05940 [Planobispora takensis]
MPAGLGADAQPGQAGRPDHGGHVVGVLGLHDRQHGLLDGTVPRQPGGVEAFVAGDENPAAYHLAKLTAYIHAVLPVVCEPMLAEAVCGGFGVRLAAT